MINRVIVYAAALLTLLVVGAGTGAASAADPPSISSHELGKVPGAVREYWTPRRMRNARPLELRLATGQVGPFATADPPRGQPVYTPAAGPAPTRPARLRSGPVMRASEVSGESTGFPGRTHAKLFLTLDGEDFVCSGTVVNSASHTLAWTAGHCVHGADIGLGFATNVMVVPGYRDGQAPYGRWPATALAAPEAWRNEANVRFDLGAVTLARDAEGRGIEDVVGASGIAFNQSRNQTFDVFGYPAADALPLIPPNFDGERLWKCHSPRTADDSSSDGDGPATMEINCDMTAGSSGGGWVIEHELVNSVTSYGYLLDSEHLYGPYMGTTAEELYKQASGPPLLCSGAQVTNLGTSGADDYSGMAGADGFLLRGGDDRASSGSGADALCGEGDADRLRGSGGEDNVRGGSGDDALRGGGGADQLYGGGGEDRLAGGSRADVVRGGGGNDVLDGGPGRDVCDGGAGRDRAIGCAETRRVP